MADTFHPQMCLHPARRDTGALGEKIDYALLWNGDCPVQQIGRPAFYRLLDLNLPIEKWEFVGEELRHKISSHFKRVGHITEKEIAVYCDDSSYELLTNKRHSKQSDTHEERPNDVPTQRVGTSA
jgi:hypothetical protein